MALRSPTTPLGRREFIALVAMMMATVAYSIDAILPAMGHIAREMTPSAPEHAQHVIPFFVIGLGIGTLVVGPLSDAVGRRPVVLGGVLVYLVGAILCWKAQTLETLFWARLIQGLGASGPRIMALAVIRDLFKGRQMAQISSLVMMIFTLVPAVAPTIGAGFIALGNWHWICISFIGFELIVGLWYFLRQPETLCPEDRRPLKPIRLATDIFEVLAHPLVRRIILAQICVFGMLFSLLSVAQPIFDVVLGRGGTFHLWMGASAILAMLAALLNAKLVVRFGMQQLARQALLLHIAATAGYLVGLETGVIAQVSVTPMFIWMALSFGVVGMVMGNLNALAMEPVGHVAGTASSAITACATVGGGVLALQVNHLFFDSQAPVLAAILAMVVVARLLLTGRLLRPEPAIA